MLAILAGMLLLASCKIPAPLTAEPTKADPNALFTAAAQTAEARRADLLLTPGPEQQLATALALTPSATASEPPTPTGPVVATVELPTTSGPAGPEDQAEFVQDVSVPDGTYFLPNERFSKIWRLKNIGTSTWTTEYALVYVSGHLLSGSPVVPMPKEVPPGETVDIAVDLVAPLEPGIFQSNWKLRNAQGQIFGAGPTSDPIWLIIAVADGMPTATSQATGVITSLSLRLDKPEFFGACPHSFIVTAEFILSQAASLTYLLEAGNDSGASIKLPPPATRNLEAGTHTVVFDLVFPSSLKGWIRLRITAPENLTSNQVNLNLVCQ